MKALVRNPVAICVLVVSLALVAALVSVSTVAFERTRQVLLVQLSQKAMVQADQTARRIDYALSLGIPMDRLSGFDTLFNILAGADGDVEFLALLGPDGKPVHVAGTDAAGIASVLATPADDTSIAGSDQSVRAGRIVTLHPLRVNDADATIVLAYKPDAASRPIRENIIDLAILLMVVLLLAFEVIALLFTLNVVMPARTARRVLASAAAGRFEWLHGHTLHDELGRMIERLNAAVRAAATIRLRAEPKATTEPRLIGARLLAFFFVFAEELARPVMVPHFTELALAQGSTTPDITIGWSVAANLIAVAITMPLASLFYPRIGSRKMYLSGAVIATIGLLGTGLAGDVTSLIAWRILSGCGYALTFVACQGFVLDSTVSRNRSSGVAMMVSGIMLADLCGPAVGGIMASHIGYEATFLVCAAMPLLAVMLTPILMGPASASAGQETPPRLDWSTIRDTLGNPSLFAVLFLIAAPAKLLLTGYLYYLVPVYLMQQGADVTEIGRVIMVYGLVALIAGPLFARLGDRAENNVRLAVCGTVLSGAGLMAVFGVDGIAAMLIGSAALGFGQALSIPAQVAIAIRVSRQAIERHGQGPVMAAMRLVERGVAAAAPITAGAMTLHFGTPTTIFAMGALSMAAGTLFAFVSWLPRVPATERA